MPFVFSNHNMKEIVDQYLQEMSELYLANDIPWVIGYSGGKDSTATLQLAWMMLDKLPAEKRRKPIHVISTDTLVEQPLVAQWVVASHDRISRTAEADSIPVIAHRLTPEIQDTFWVNLIGRGYPAPRNKFRWCTERMKIQPSNRFIRDIIKKNGEAIVVLGTRKAESRKRKGVMERHEKYRYRDRLSPNSQLPNSLIYTPIEDWDNDDVWLFLMQNKNPWGHDNKSLLTMYRGASSDGECPLVLDTSTPSCGNSRFGCWICTIVDKDRSMEAMIKNDEEKLWMMPLLELRNELGEGNDRHRRDFRRRNGKVQLFNGRVIPGPYTKEWREHWLRRLLTIQHALYNSDKEELRCVNIIGMDELHEIRRIWLTENHEFDDALPLIYREVTGEDFSVTADDSAVLTREDWLLLEELCGNERSFFQLQVQLLDTERQFRGMSRRGGIFQALTDCFNRHLYPDEETATHILTERKESMDKARELANQRGLDVF